MKEQRAQFHRARYDPIGEFWRNYNGIKDYKITEGSKYSRIRITKSLKDKAKFFKTYLKRKGYCVWGPVRTPNFVIYWYRKKPE